METYQYIIVDDEQSAIDELEYHLTPYKKQFACVGTATTIDDALELIESTNPDIAFLDINIGADTSFELLKKLRFRSFKIIFVTAHQDYLLQALRLSCVDYLLKPIQPTEFKAAIERLKQSMPTEKNFSNSINVLHHNLDLLNKIKKISLPTRKGYIVKSLNELVYIKANSNYSEFMFADSIKYSIAKTLLEYEEMMEPFGFIRIHQSYLVNLSFVEFFYVDDLSITLSSGISLPVSTRRKSLLVEKLKSIM